MSRFFKFQRLSDDDCVCTLTLTNGIVAFKVTKEIVGNIEVIPPNLLMALH